MVRINKNQEEKIVRYCHELGYSAVFFSSLSSMLKAIGKKDCMLLSRNRFIRGVAKKLKWASSDPDVMAQKAEFYFPFKDSVILLAQKQIPVFFYNRIGKESGYGYADSAKARMQKGLSFPVMYAEMDKYEKDLRELFGPYYSRDYIEKIGKISQVIQKGECFCHEDCRGEYVNVIDGKRITCYQPEKYEKTIHIYGRCGAFGYAVEDKDTLPSQIQKKLIERGYRDVRVINHGLWGGDDSCIDHNFYHDAIRLKKGDIVVFYRKHFDKRLYRQLEKAGVSFKDITHVWHQHEEAKWCFYDRPGHMNYLGYQFVADAICDDLIEKNFDALPVEAELLKDFSARDLNQYLKQKVNTSFAEEIQHYVDGIISVRSVGENEVNGSIVMNCNPFTKGHRYLIEKAASQVDTLYVFVVEENKSFFTFEDRFEMVRAGVKDLPNVVTVPSGRFIISSLTFPEYFMKDYVKERDFDVSMDLEVFCKYIARPLHIIKRFAGEEPFDPVTSRYNENMHRILPEYGLEFCEIPRLAIDSGCIINATEVRRLLAANDFETLRDYVPDSTMKILKEKYSKNNGSNNA